jgi:hypothetical protein
VIMPVMREPPAYRVGGSPHPPQWTISEKLSDYRYSAYVCEFPDCTVEVWVRKGIEAFPSMEHHGKALQ